MKSVVVAVAIGMAWTPPAAAEAAPRDDRYPYLALRAGAALPQHRDVKGLGNGHPIEAAVGYRVGANLALEASIGRMEMSGKEQPQSTFPGAVPADMKVTVTPTTLSLKVFAALQPLDLYVLAGFGWYRASTTVTDVQVFGRPSFSASSSDFGVHAGGGAGYAIHPRVTLGVEARYVVASAASAGSGQYRLDSLLGLASVAVGL